MVIWGMVYYCFTHIMAIFHSTTYPAEISDVSETCSAPFVPFRPRMLQKPRDFVKRMGVFGEVAISMKSCSFIQCGPPFTIAKLVDPSNTNNYGFGYL